MNSAQPTPPLPEPYEALAKLVDYTMLDPVLSNEDLAARCREARELDVRAIVVRPCDVELVAGWMRGSGVVVASVAGYPHGTGTTATKLYELRELLRLGATEIELALNPARMISRNFQHVEVELMQAAKSCHESGARLTVAFQNQLLADDLKIIGTKICRRVEVDTLALDHSDADLAVFRPLLKDVLRLKHALPVETLEDAFRVRGNGYASFRTDAPGPLLAAWRQHIAPPPPLQS